MILRELKLFACALQFLTRLPTPHLRDFQPEWIQASARYYPLVGLMVGAISAAVLWTADQVWGPWIAAILAVAAGMAATGCFHEDGLADTADGIGGGQTRDRRLEIMKDSRLGTYGASVLVLNLMLRVAALAMLVQVDPVMAALCLIAAHGAGRAVAVLAMAVMPYGGHPGMAKEGRPDRTAWPNVIVGAAFAALPFVAFQPTPAIIGVSAGLLLALVPVWLAWRLLGGRTGDVLGAIEQAFEAGFLLALAGILA
ncbi:MULTISPECIES: adenosylcobinamide-GDP ribazoletransferase [unclassified Brevundimonas]|uniref:adenosylcobinamide-GDP ribazoletransferase n=1 Tax=unclassified Brevundimonas TaxID=2622653 RepID=UPI0025C3D9C7|nr:MULTISPECIES: adenosylcobinamide-GDP ribazoletransferase [unclassified Brevundimonas]